MAEPQSVRSGGITALGALLIVGGVLGLPFLGLGLIGIVAGIIILAVVKNETRELLYCSKCRAVRPHRLAPFLK